MSNKIYPIGIQNFEKIRQDGYFYIDKTALMYQMVKTGSYYFLSRPRRFGKSLLISTLEAYFQGKKELFAGLAVEKLEKDWMEHPILHLDLNIEKYDTSESLDKILNDNLEYWESKYGLVRQRPHFLCVLPVLSNVLMKRPVSGWLSWWMNMTSRCCSRLAMRSCNSNSGIP